MYPTLGHLLSDLFGTPINFPIPTYGTMLVLAFILAYQVMHFELRRKEKSGQMLPGTRRVLKGKPASITELAFSGFIGFIIGFKLIGILVNYDSFAADVESYIFSGRGNFVGGLLGGGLLAGLNYWEKSRKRLEKPEWAEETVHPYQHKGNILLIAALAGIIGAKLFHQFENWDEFLADPLGSLFSRGGLTFYGGLILGALAVIWYCRKQGLSLLHMMDVAAPAIIIAYGTGRIGCMIAGDGCWGVCNLAFATSPDAVGVALAKPDWLSFLPDWMFAYTYPHNVINEGILLPDCHDKYCSVLADPVFPTPFYETVVSYLIFGVLWLTRKRIQVAGVLFGMLLMMNGVERFFIEKIRINTTYQIFGGEITQAEIISSLLFIAGLTMVVILLRKNRQKKAKGGSTS